MENGHKAGVDADLESYRARTEEMRAEIRRQFAEFEVARRDMQATLLNAFRNMAQSIELRLIEREVHHFFINERLSAIETRQTEVERRLNMPPQP